MAWAHNAVLPFFVLVMGMKAKLVIHPLYHSKKINCNTTNFPNNEWEAEVKNIIVKAMRTALGDLAEESNNSKDKKKRKSNTGIMKAQNKRCKIEGCEEPLASAGKVCCVCNIMVCIKHGNNKEWDGNNVVQMILDVCDDQGWLSRGANSSASTTSCPSWRRS